MKKTTIFVVFVFCLAILTADTFAAGQKRYADTPLFNDAMADAPWRVKSPDTPLPIGFFINDTNIDDLNELHTAEVFLVRNGANERIFFHDFDDQKIEETFWEYVVTHFENADNPDLNGKPITPAALGFGTGDTVELIASMKGEDDAWQDDLDFTIRLRVEVGEPFPRPDGNWLYGDAHYHTQFTRNPYEYGAGLSTIRLALAAIDLDWVTLTDHASDNNGWDLDETDWNTSRNRINAMNTQSGLPFLMGEEITCQPVAGREENGVHLLVYNNDTFISGKISTEIHAKYDLNSRLAALNSAGLAFAAHPSDNMEVNRMFGIDIGDIIPWSADNFGTALSYGTFYGLEIWNTRMTMRTTGGDLDNINPFTRPLDSGGTGWAQPENLADQNAYLDNLNESLVQWETLLLANLDPIRKIVVNAGSDAHGDLNYFTSLGDFTDPDDVDCYDNAVGKARTLVYAPARTGASVLAGMKNGHAIITDGPVLLIGMDNNQDNMLNKSDGDAIVGDVVGVADMTEAVIFIQWIAYGNVKIRSIRLILNGEPLTEIIPENGIRGYATHTLTLGEGQGNRYIRAECVSDEFINKSGFPETYRAYTNPIWFASQQTGPRLPGNVSVYPSGGTFYASPALVDVSCPNAERIYCKISVGTDGTVPADPPEPTIESHDVFNTNSDEYIGASGKFGMSAETDQIKVVKVTFRGYNENGYGPTSQTHTYTVDLKNDPNESDDDDSAIVCFIRALWE